MYSRDIRAHQGGGIMDYKAIIFDLDGTLLDTITDIANAMNRVLDKQGYSGFSVEMYKKFVGNGIGNFVRQALPAGEFNSTRFGEILDDFRTAYVECWEENTRPFPGVMDLLADLVEKGLALSILSNKTNTITRAMVTSLLPGIPFTSVLGERAGVPRKPDPAVAREQAALMGVHPGDVMLVGDSEVDMKTAGAAGMFAVGVSWGFRNEYELRSEGAAAILENPADLLQLFD
jgi:phosphoglycolate phosphatase